MALIGIITAIEAMNQSLKRAFLQWAQMHSVSVLRTGKFVLAEDGKVKKTIKGALKEKNSNMGKLLLMRKQSFLKKDLHFPAV